MLIVSDSELWSVSELLVKQLFIFSDSTISMHVYFLFNFMQVDPLKCYILDL